MAKCHVKGLVELQATLREANKKAAARAGDQGLRAGASFLAGQMRAAAYAKPMRPGYQSTGKLRGSLRFSVGIKGRAKLKAWVKLGLAPGESRILFYYKTLERGRMAYQRRFAKVKGARRFLVRGHLSPLRPFFWRTWNANKGKVAEIIAQVTLQALGQEVGLKRKGK